MLKIKIISLSLLVFISSLSFADELTFTKGQRHAIDITSDSQRKGAQVIDLVGIENGMVIGDVLGGGGYYSELLSKKVGSEGKIFLHNNEAYMPWIEKEIVARLKGSRLPNVIRHDRETDNLDFADKSFDAIFFVLGYHDLYHVANGWKIDKDDFLQQLDRALKPHGKLLIVDHSAKAGTGTEHAQNLHRIDREYVIKELTSKGYKLINSSDLLANPNDKRVLSPFKPKMKRKTDRFVLVFEKKA
jgi:predicted methyltransferase